MSDAASPIERAARALFEYEPGPYGDCVEWAIEQEFGWRARVAEVELVLKAIREPSESMVKAGNRSKPFNVKGYCEGTIHPVVQRAWPAMIDAALADEEE